MSGNILFYDDTCNLCHWSVELVRKIDRNRRIRTFPLNSMYFKDFQKNNLTVESDSIIYFSGGRTYYKSAAVLHIFRDTGWPWRSFFILKIIPSGIRDRIYEFIAGRRYKWFGRKASCEACNNIYHYKENM